MATLVSALYGSCSILREINFEDFKSCKNALLAILKALNFNDLTNFSHQKMQNAKEKKKSQVRVSQFVKMGL